MILAALLWLALADTIPNAPSGLVATAAYTGCVCVVPAKFNTGAPDDVVPCVGEVGPFVWFIKSEIGWHDGEACSSVGWDVIRGVLGDWPTSRASCLVDESWKCAWFASDPMPGVGFYYLVRGHNVCGTGSWGFQGNAMQGVERTNVACPTP